MTTDFIIRLLAAAAIGSVIGIEREYRAKEAGFRTHFLVALGSALFMVVSQHGFELVRSNANMSLDPSRIASQVVTGIGFIGAGIIIFQKHVVRGLTTAAGLWVTSAIGLACGSGLYEIAIATMLLSLFCLEALHFAVKGVEPKRITATFTSQTKEEIANLVDRFNREHIDIQSYHIQRIITDDKYFYKAVVEINTRAKNVDNILKKLMIEYDGVDIEEIE